MNGRRLGITTGLVILAVTLIDTVIHILLLDIRPDVMATFPMVGEVISEGFNVIFAIVLLLVLGFGYEKGKPRLYLMTAGSFFYISQLHDFYDEFFVLSIPSIAFEVFAFPLALIFATLGLYKALMHQRGLNEDNERLKLMYRDLSITDMQTGLYNTRHFYDTVPELIKRYKTSGRSLVLLIMDIDDFKMVNDTYGHLEGDRLIERLGNFIIDHFSGDCLSYRYGGEEFVVVLGDTSVDEAVEKAESFRQQFSQLAFDNEGQTYSKTISIGLSALEPGDDTKSLLQKADQAMYDAKSTGKNKVSCQLS